MEVHHFLQNRSLVSCRFDGGRFSACFSNSSDGQIYVHWVTVLKAVPKVYTVPTIGCNVHQSIHGVLSMTLTALRVKWKHPNSFNSRHTCTIGYSHGVVPCFTEEMAINSYSVTYNPTWILPQKCGFFVDGFRHWFSYHFLIHAPSSRPFLMVTLLTTPQALEKQLI